MTGKVTDPRDAPFEQEAKYCGKHVYIVSRLPKSSGSGVASFACGVHRSGGRTDVSLQRA